MNYPFSDLGLKIVTDDIIKVGFYSRNSGTLCIIPKLLHRRTKLLLDVFPFVFALKTQNQIDSIN